MKLIKSISILLFVLYFTSFVKLIDYFARFCQSGSPSLCPAIFKPSKGSSLVLISTMFEGMIIFTPSSCKSSELSVISSKVSLLISSTNFGSVFVKNVFLFESPSPIPVDLNRLKKYSSLK